MRAVLFWVSLFEELRVYFEVMKIFLTFLLFVSAVCAQDAPGVNDVHIVAVGEAELEKDKITFLANWPEKGIKVSDKALIDEFQTVLFSDFGYYRKRFEVVEQKARRSDFDPSQLDAWSEKTRYLGHVHYENRTYKASLYDTGAKTLLAEFSGNFNRQNLRQTAHQLSDRIYTRITGVKSMFLSQIVFVSDRHGTRKNPVKELYIMDFDGKRPRRLTQHWGTVISPAFDLANQRVLYSLIEGGKKKKKNINLRILDLKTKKSRLLSQRAGINSGAVFMPDGEHILLTLSHQGNAEIYQMHFKTLQLRRITRHYSPDVDPSINAKGDKMTFLSGRSGMPMIYTLDPVALEKSVKRISFVGKFNATPRFSPDGGQIAFSSWLDNRFDIFRINADGSGLYRLTKDFGSNEDPSYSPDGQFIVFSSKRVLSRYMAIQSLYIMTSEGEIIGTELTKSLGNCTTPRWSKSL